jgi:CheY-like chemotaxis protein
MSNKPIILCVDDDTNVVESMQLNLRKHYIVRTALSGPLGLEVLREDPDVAVVVSDMRMPDMDGAAFLAEVKSVAPSAVRMLLTGYSDIEAAMRAVNEGQIFRFLTKPCEPAHLLATLEAGVAQHRLITAERVLLQKTLLGCVKALVEILALSNPMALGRAARIRDTVRKLARELRLEQSWRVEFAALLSQLGAVSLSDETVRKLYDGEQLEGSELSKLVDNMATINHILGNIPRLEPVTDLLEELRTATAGDTRCGNKRTAAGRLLQAAIDLDSLEAQGHTSSATLEILGEHKSVYGEETLAALTRLKGRPGELRTTTVKLAQLADGMILCEDLKTPGGVLILPRGFAVNISSREHVMNFADELGDVAIQVSTANPDDAPEVDAPDMAIA